MSGFVFLPFLSLYNNLSTAEKLIDEFLVLFLRYTLAFQQSHQDIPKLLIILFIRLRFDWKIIIILENKKRHWRIIIMSY